MRQIIISTLAFVAFLALAHIVAGQQGIVGTGVRTFAYNGFKATDELDFGVEFNPTFGPANLKLLFYDPLGGAERIEVGAVWYKHRVQLDSFNITFTVSMSNNSYTSGGNPDGFALVVQNYRANAFGAGGGGIGYGATPDYEDLGVRKSVAIEFDTFMDPDLNDPNSNHISVHYTTPTLIHNSADEANALNPPGAATNVPPIAGNTHTYNVYYLSKQLSVYVDGNPTPAYQGTIDVANVLSLNSSGAYVGLTAACVGTCEDVAVSNFTFNYVSILDAPFSFVTSVNNVTTAGQPATFVIQGVDTNGYLYTTGGNAGQWTVSFAPIGISGTVASPSVSLTDNSNGSYLVAYTPTTAGLYAVTVYLNSNPIAGMPFTVRVNPAAVDPLSSDVSGNVNGGVAGQVLNITILGKDPFGNVNPNNVPPITFTATFSNSATTFPSTFVGNGTYVIPYTLTSATTYVLTITYNGTAQQVKGSPFSPVTITPALPYAASSYATGAGIVGGTAGVSLPLVVVVRDMYQNNITAGMPANYQLYGSWNRAAAGNNVTFSLQSGGTYGASYTVTTAGTYQLNIALGPNALPISGSPFSVTIAPQTITSPALSVAFGPGLTTASAGSNATFTVQARDTFGNNMTSSTATIGVSFVDDTGVPLNLFYTAVQNAANPALFTVSYIPTQATNTHIGVTLNGTPIMGSSFVVAVQPGPLDPTKCFAQIGITTPKTKVPLSFAIVTADHYGNRLRTGGAAIAVTLTEYKSGASVVATVQDPGNGGYNAVFTLTKTGTYNITITANGTPIDIDRKSVV